jgi:hypothetical protein
MNQQKRRMRELAHKKEIEILWQEKLAVYREQREQEWEEKRIKEQDEAIAKSVIARQKEELLKQHADILS